MSSYKLNFEQQGNALAVIKSEKKSNAKKYQPMICIGEEIQNGFETLQLKSGECFVPVPNISKERDVLYVIGQSGSGKSYFVCQYAKEYKKMYSKRQVYIFSTLDSDPEGLDKIGKVNRIKLDDAFIKEDMIPTEEFQNALIIFDDIDSIDNKLTREVVFKYLNNFLQTGRHHKISLAITYHIGCSGHSTKMILNECTSITYFPAIIGGKNLKYLLDSYLGMSKSQIERIKKIESRAVTIFKTYPKVVMAEKQMYILRND